MDSIEKAVLELRALVGAEGLGGRGAALTLLLEHLSERLAVSRSAVRVPYLLESEHGLATLVLPYHVPPHQYEDVILHEALHVSLSICYPGVGCGPHSRNGSRGERRDEATIRRAARAWKLPADHLGGNHTDEELADLTGLSVADVRLRRHEAVGH